MMMLGGAVCGAFLGGKWVYGKIRENTGGKEGKVRKE